MDPEKLRAALDRSAEHQEQAGRAIPQSATFCTAGGQSDSPQSWEKSSPKGIFPPSFSAPNENHYLDGNGDWIHRDGFGPYRKDLETSGVGQFKRSLTSLLKLYDFNFDDLTIEDDHLTIRARSKR